MTREPGGPTRSQSVSDVTSHTEAHTNSLPVVNELQAVKVGNITASRAEVDALKLGGINCSMHTTLLALPNHRLTKTSSPV